MRTERKWKGFVGVERASEETEGRITTEKTGVKPLHRGDTAVLQAIESLEKRGFSNIKFNDIFRAGKRFGIMDEDNVYDALENATANKYVQGYGHRVMRYMKFSLTSQGRAVLEGNGGEGITPRGTSSTRELEPVSRRTQRPQMGREIGEPGSGAGARGLSEAEMGVLETIYELKNKRRMSKVLINDVLRRGQTKHKGIREDNVGSVLKGLRAGGFLRWIMPGYELTTKGREILNV